MQHFGIELVKRDKQDKLAGLVLSALSALSDRGNIIVSFT